MAVNELQRLEFIAAEQRIVTLFSKVKPPFGTMILESKNVQAHIDKAEAFILLCMTENGLVDGDKLSEIIYQTKPELFGWINIPKENFRLVDKIDEIITMIIGGSR